MNPFILIAENKIREAMENGEFDNLACQGKPIDFTEDEHIPAEYRLAYRILKNSGHTGAEGNPHRQARAAREEAKQEGSKNEFVERLIQYKEAVQTARANKK
jgi:hypothetical protein